VPLAKPQVPLAKPQVPLAKPQVPLAKPQVPLAIKRNLDSIVYDLLDRIDS